MPEKHFLGIDVGTGSARPPCSMSSARCSVPPKRTLRCGTRQAQLVEQSSSDIWRAVCACVQDAVRQAGIPTQSIAGIGFDATCSLVVLGPGGEPLPVGPSGDPERNIIVWLDHRAVAQARRINAAGEVVLWRGDKGRQILGGARLAECQHISG